MENNSILQSIPLVRTISLKLIGKAVFVSKCLYLKTQGRISHLKFRRIG